MLQCYNMLQVFQTLKRQNFHQTKQGLGRSLPTADQAMAATSVWLLQLLPPALHNSLSHPSYQPSSACPPLHRSLDGIFVSAALYRASRLLWWPRTRSKTKQSLLLWKKGTSLRSLATRMTPTSGSVFNYSISCSRALQYFGHTGS
jgi:hypothetical protein